MSTEWLIKISEFAGIIIVVGIIGFLIGRKILKQFALLTRKTETVIDDILIKSLTKSIILWAVLLGIYLAFNVVELPEELSNKGQKVLLSLLFFSVFWFLANFLAELVDKSAGKLKEVLPATSIFKNLTKIFVFLIGILVILQTLGISITPIITALGIGGLAVALALQDTLSNLFAGLHIVAARKIRAGDYIELDSGEKGYVVDISWRNTTIRELSNNLIIIPNIKLSNVIVKNFCLPDAETAVLVNMGVAYGSDLQKVEKVTIEVAKEVMCNVKGGVPEFNPFIRYNTFDDFSINFTVILRGKEVVDQYLIKHEFIKGLKTRYDREGIVIPFPIRTVYLQETK